MTNSSKSNLENHLDHLIRLRDPYLSTEGHFYVQHYIQAELEKFGAVEVHEFKVGQRVHRNLIQNLSHPANHHQPPILIAAHYDAVVGSPGADDNATGVAVLLELSRILATESLPYPLRLIAFDLEESGLQGSRSYAQKLKQQQQRLRLMISLEMLGYSDSTSKSQQYPPGLDRFYPNTGDFIALIGNVSTIPDLMHLCRSIEQAGVSSRWLPVPLKGRFLPDTRRSDHAPFWDNGYPAVLITDTANLRNPHYHKSTDTLATLNLDFLTGILSGLVLSLKHFR